MESILFFAQSITSFAYDPLFVVVGASGVILALTICAVWLDSQTNFIKAFFFSSISAVVIVTTLYIVLGTVQLVRSSSTGGPVHWHADFRAFRCGEELDLIDPSGFSNKEGTQTVHEHGDKRIHIEGIPEEETIASLKNFIRAVGGTLSHDAMSFPTQHGDTLVKNGDMCVDGEGFLQVFLWKTKKGEAVQSKLESFPEYIISPEVFVPPGDCIIFEFDVPKPYTEHICEQYEIAESNGDINIKIPSS